MEFERIRSRKSTGRFRHLPGLLAAAALALIVIAAVGYREALAPPIERHLTVRVDSFPVDESPLRLVLISDAHVHGPDMPPDRLGRIVAEINREHPDVVVAAGDFVGDNWIGAHYPINDALAPLAGLHARLGVFAVLGNNDHLAGDTEVARALSAAHVRVLSNQAIRVGPIVLGGVDYRLDEPPKKALSALYSTLALMEPMHGPKVVVAHSPDIFPSVPSSISLVLAGHTHCGQIAIPFVGPLLTGSQFGRQFACGVYRDKDRVLVVTGGLGTSHVPVRLAAPPDFWVVSISGRSK